MPSGLWLALVLGSLIAGCSLVAVLVVPRAQEPFVAAAGLAAAGTVLWAFISLEADYQRVDAVAYGLVVIVGFLVGGFALASAFLDRLAPRSPASLTLPQVGSPERKILVLLIACAERERYSPTDTARELTLLADHGLLQLSIGVTPFLFAAHKARYKAVGGKSPSRAQLRRVAEALEDRLDSDIFERVDVAVCDGTRHLAARLAAAAVDGYSTVVISVLGIAQSFRLDAALRDIDAMRPAQSGMTVVTAPPLWGSERLAEAIVAQIMAAVTDLDWTGVTLLSQAQPEAWQRTNPAFDAHQTAFASRVRMMLVERGLKEEHVRVAYDEWSEPDAASAIRHLAALGCRRIIVSPVSFPLESLGTLFDLPLAVRQARVDTDIPVVTLPAWGELNETAEALHETIAEVIADQRS